MKKSITHLPKRTQQELTTLTELITQEIKGCVMIILFGSYARGGYVLWDEKFDFGTHTSYQSDLDIMVVISDQNIRVSETRLRHNVTEKYHKILKKLRNPSPESKVSYYPSPQFIVEFADNLNDELRKKQYFYTDIVKEGIMLYDNGAHKLADVRDLSYEDIKKIAVDEYTEKMGRGGTFLDIGHYIYNKEKYKDGSFILHQACERYYKAISLVFTNYSPQSHKLTELAALVKSYSRELAILFPKYTPNLPPKTFEEKCYGLLCRAYIEARYNREFDVTKEEYEHMLERVELLKTITEKICTERIESYDLLIEKTDMSNNLITIANKFNIEGTIKDISPLGEGFINDTLIVTTLLDETPNYILQRKNKKIFTDVPAMMDNIVRVTAHLKEKVREQGGDELREAMTVLFTIEENLPYFIDEEGEFWTVTLFISNSKSFDNTEDSNIAYQGGVGVGKFQCQMADFKETLHDILPGFHNIRFRFEQWDEAVKNDIAGRVIANQKEIQWVESRREEMMKFWELIETGAIPMRVSHNDTKINNVLFDATTQKALCMIDLDTVLSSNILNDFGDAVRTYTNTGKEDDESLENVTMSITAFKSFCDGYLSEARTFLTPIEIEYIPFSGRFIVFEQVLRFMMDYLNGDTYYKIKYPEHNLVRTRAQYALLQSIESQYDEMVNFVI